MKILNIILIYLCLALIALSVGMFEAFIVGPFRGPTETVGGSIAIVMLIGALPLSGGAFIVWLIKDLFRR